MNAKEVKCEKILVPHGAIKEISERMNVSRVTVAAALNGKTFSLVSEKIRELAVSEFKGK